MKGAATNDAPGLDALAREAAAVEEGPADRSSGAESGDIPPVDQTVITADEAAHDAQEAATWAAIPRMVGSVLAMAMPEMRAVYSDEACDAWGKAMMPVARKRGWNVDSAGPEITLFLATVPFALGTAAVMAQRKKAARGAAPARPGAGKGEPAPAGVPIDAAPPDLNANPEP